MSATNGVYIYDGQTEFEFSITRYEPWGKALLHMRIDNGLSENAMEVINVPFDATSLTRFIDTLTELKEELDEARS